MSSKILLKSGTNEVEILELYLDEGRGDKRKRWSFGLNVAKVKKIVKEVDLKNFSGRKDADIKKTTTGKIDSSNILVLGMFEFMGSVIPLIDLSGWLRMDRVRGENRMVLITEFNNVTSAFLVSGVNRIHRISWEELESLQGNMVKYAEGTIIGTVKLTDPNRILQVLDLEQALDDLSPANSDEALLDVAEVDEVFFKAVCADDSRSMRNLVTQALEKGGFSVDAFVNGKDLWDALLIFKEKAEQSGKPITDFLQLVVSDIEMPGMDGHAVTRRIKGDPILKDLTVFLFSSLITEELLHKGESVGADRQYSKPQIASLVAQAWEDANTMMESNR
ncbi:two-component system, chemotaxis family, response regulator CheV [Maridesulfovibrio ferrireducens]|uniref:Two-component system, chemotaxis family, response regulator CheV n=1 Tax=Maridesulfovibrio ferrireducens TaxID=246191 RepID=A0A1G9JP51_9BACT|nr:chemotaxis protein CheW [Maridesulfovibrio ferrireducens]SDL39289.1 two-component system, chemotaxis family, response regulator CheV [Maridesulfovibrio ferrireducens]